jgi:hypothetical protein
LIFQVISQLTAFIGVAANAYSEPVRVSATEVTIESMIREGIVPTNRVSSILQTKSANPLARGRVESVSTSGKWKPLSVVKRSPSRHIETCDGCSPVTPEITGDRSLLHQK